MYLAEIGLELCLAQVCQTQLRDNVLPYFLLSFRLLQQFHWHKGPQQWIYILFFSISRFVCLSYAQRWWDTPTELCLMYHCSEYVCLFQRVFAHVCGYVYVCVRGILIPSSLWCLCPLNTFSQKMGLSDTCYFKPHVSGCWLQNVSSAT